MIERLTQAIESTQQSSHITSFDLIAIKTGDRGTRDLPLPAARLIDTHFYSDSHFINLQFSKFIPI